MKTDFLIVVSCHICRDFSNNGSFHVTYDCFPDQLLYITAPERANSVFSPELINKDIQSPEVQNGQQFFPSSYQKTSAIFSGTSSSRKATPLEKK